jgi:hypothetical protein
MRAFAFAAAGLVLLAGASGAGAAEVTRMTQRLPGERPDIAVGLLWTSDLASGALRRETTSPGGRAVVNDLRYEQTRHVLTLHGEVGLWRGLSLSLTAPFVVADDRKLSFDRQGCVAGQTCVDESRSTLLRDGVLPGAGAPTFGWDAQRGRPFERPSTDVFRGVTRRGLEWLGVGFRWRVFDEAATPVLPTWLLWLESRFAVTEEMRFDRPTGGNKAVGPGYHALVLGTAFSRRLGWAEPYVTANHLLPFAKEGSAYERYPLGEGAFSRPQQRTQLEAGLETVVWEDAPARQRVAFEFRGRAEARFAGLARGPLWEPLTGSGACATQAAACRSGIDRDFDGDGDLDPHPGVVRSPAYGLYGGDVGVQVQVGPFVRFRGLAGVAFEQPHALTDGGSPDVVLDAPGRRFRVEGARVWTITLDGVLTF